MVVEAGITGLVGAMCGVATGIVVGGLMIVLSGLGLVAGGWGR